jgi:GNAT superfamily N-acetyltransferase
MTDRDIEIVPTEAAHAERVCDLIRASIRVLCTDDHGSDPNKIDSWLANKTVGNVRNWAADPRNIFVHAVCGGVIAGAASASRDGNIQLVYVDPGYRYQGISSALLAHLERELARHGATRARLASTRTAHAFYRRNGWRGVGDGQLSMVKELGQRARQDQFRPLEMLRALRQPARAIEGIRQTATAGRLQAAQLRPWLQQVMNRF